VLASPALRRVGGALAVGALCAWLAPADFRTAPRAVAGWDGFCLTVLALTRPTIFRADAAHIRRVATGEDPGRTATFGAVLAAAGASLFAVALLLRGIKALPPREQLAHVAVSVVAIFGAWLLHTLFTLRYAHAYFSEDRATDPPDLLGGLDFPGAAPTTYWDFATTPSPSA